MPEDQSLDQRRAAFAWAHVPASVQKEVVTIAAGAPALMMQNGLMQTLAYYQEKGKKNLTVLDVVVKWLSRKGGVLEGEATFEGMMGRLHGCDSDQYMLATEEALEILKWFRQLAKARERVGG